MSLKSLHLSVLNASVDDPDLTEMIPAHHQNPGHPLPLPQVFPTPCPRKLLLNPLSAVLIDFHTIKSSANTAKDLTLSSNDSAVQCPPFPSAMSLEPVVV